jgi:hypothetical protein
MSSPDWTSALGAQADGRESPRPPAGSDQDLPREELGASEGSGAYRSESPGCDGRPGARHKRA